MTNADRMLEAIRVINAATLRPWTRPAQDASAEMWTAWDMAQRAEPGGLKLRAFQRAGISSRLVAEAIGRGVLCVAMPEDP